MSYTPKTWVNGELITATDLNNMETGIANASSGSSEGDTFFVIFSYDSLIDEYSIDKTIEEIKEAYTAHKNIIGQYGEYRFYLISCLQTAARLTCFFEFNAISPQVISHKAFSISKIGSGQTTITYSSNEIPLTSVSVTS